MRLGQLARKLSLRPAQIVEFLAQNNIQIEDNSNTRIEDNHTELVVNHFAPGTFQQVSELVEEPEESKAVENEQRVVEEVTAQGEISEQQVSTDAEVIRVPKIELSGLKVLGKIELPELKKKEVVVEKTEEEITAPAEEIPAPAPIPTPERKQRIHHKKPVHQKRDRPREWKNPLEQQRERETREAEEKKRMAAEREKERRKSHYEEKRKVVPSVKRAKPVKEQPVQKKRVDTRPVPKTWFGKFLRWWTT